MDRRRFFMQSSGLLLATATATGWADNVKNTSTQAKVRPTPTPAAGKPKSSVIVIGGGMAGATVAKYLRLWGDNIAVTLVERSATYTSNIMSSMVLTG